MGEIGEVQLNFNNGNGGVERWDIGLKVVLETLTNGGNFDMQGNGYRTSDDLIVIFFFFGSFFMRRFVGFSFTFDSDINEPASNPKAFTHFVRHAEGTRRQRQIKSLIRSRNRRRSH